MSTSTIVITAILIVISTLPSTIKSQTTTTSPSPNMPTTTTKNPEDCANRIYSTIRGFRGTKEELFKKLEAQFNMEMKGIRVNEFSNENYKKVTDTVAKRLSRDDIINVEDFRKFADTMIQKWRATGR
ncbi:unnamed protein product [Chironomus riparius]|uniref:Uncharacterized protein n=1 Tax=Chironomus riparius TaxID=315576 RepID=A0A9N9S7H9_9DIPT|nr:unnamed protein product [Chironomus riparius]